MHDCLLTLAALVVAACAVRLVQQGEKSMAHLDRITAEVSEMKSAADSAVVLLDTIAAKLRELANDPAAIAALADELDASGSALAAAVVRNTPAEGSPPPA